MKKNLLLLIGLSPLVLNAQITINSSHLPTVGHSFVDAIDDTYSAPILPGGANQNWNYTSLQNLDQDTTTFIAAATTPYGPSYYPSSNMAIHTPEDSLYLYVTTNTGGLYIDGYYFYTSQAPFGQNAISFSPSYLFIPTPFTYLDTQTSYYKYVIDIDTALPYIRFVHQVNQAFVGDGYGALQLPTATYPNTLRIKATETIIDSLLADTIGNGSYFMIDPPTVSQQSNYYWLQAAQPVILLTISADSLGTTGESSSYVLSSTTSVQEPQPETKANVNVYPNPAGGLVNVTLLKEGTSNTIFRLFDMQGRVIRETSLEGIQQYGFYVNHLERGVYLWSIDDAGAQGKLVVE
ncbi:MAG: T9SS type A sorting domain-containing protein [Bacteroidetes bacterium]|nr:T9SS type A sorting domain-containing protein [Bacteroidota bacterium]